MTTDKARVYCYNVNPFTKQTFKKEEGFKLDKRLLEAAEEGDEKGVEAARNNIRYAEFMAESYLNFLSWIKENFTPEEKISMANKPGFNKVFPRYV